MQVTHRSSGGGRGGGARPDVRAARHRAGRGNPAGLGQIAAWSGAVALPVAFLGVFFVWPVAAMLVRGFVGDAGWDFSGFAEVLSQERTWRIIWQTLWMALGGTAGAVVLGIPGAYALYRCTFPGSRVLRAISSVPFVLPSVVVGVAFRALLGKGGAYEALGLDGTASAVVMAMVFFNFSVVVRTVGGMWAGLDPRAEEAARTLGASPLRALFTVTLPALRPAIGAAASLVFLFCSTAYGIVQTLGRPGYGTLESEIWVQTTTFLDLRTAAVLSCVQFVIVAIALALSNKLNNDVALRMNPVAPRKVRRGDVAAVGLTVAVVVLLLIAPMASLASRAFRHGDAWGMENFRLLNTAGQGFTGGVSPAQALRTSAEIGLQATVIALIIGVPVALVLSRRTRGALRGGQRLLDSLVMLPLGISAVTVGFGFFISLRGALPNEVMVPLVQAVIALPLVVRSLVPVLRAIDPRLREAAATLGASPLRVLLTVDGPFMIRGLGLATGFAFAISLGEFGATSFLATADRTTLPVLIAKLLGRPGADNYGMAMAASLILAIVTAGVMALCESLRPRAAGKNVNAGAHSHHILTRQPGGPDVEPSVTTTIDERHSGGSDVEGFLGTSNGAPVERSASKDNT
ncbi:ABC transporter permease [Ancrocorticia sp.]|uniref:ABC transporter permease n=1 Tax=Ancrocorticia sp. TaxID=2593684 RepID=UPI003F8F16D1